MRIGWNIGCFFRFSTRFVPFFHFREKESARLARLLEGASTLREQLHLFLRNGGSTGEIFGGHWPLFANFETSQILVLHQEIVVDQHVVADRLEILLLSHLIFLISLIAEKLSILVPYACFLNFASMKFGHGLAKVIVIFFSVLIVRIFNLRLFRGEIRLMVLLSLDSSAHF